MTAAFTAGISCKRERRQHPKETGSVAAMVIPARKEELRDSRTKMEQGKRETRDLSRKRQDNAILNVVISPGLTVIGRTSAYNAAMHPLHPLYVPLSNSTCI